MEPTPEFIQALYQEQIQAARATSVDDKLLGGLRLFDRSCRLMTDGIRHQHPDATEEDVQRLLLERLDLARRLEEWP